LKTGLEGGVDSSKEEFLGELRLGRKLTTAGQTAEGGIAIMLGLLFLLSNQVLGLSNTLAPLVSLLSSLVFGITLASVVELLGGSGERGGTYALVEETIGGLTSFLTGWSILMGSLVLLVALLRTAASQLLALISTDKISSAAIASIFFVLLILIQLFQLSPKRLRLRVVLFPLLGLFLVAVLAAIPRVNFRLLHGSAPITPGAIYQSVGLLGIGYAAFEALLISRRQIHDPGRHLPGAILRTLVTGGAMFVFTWLVIVGLNIPTTSAGSLIVTSLSLSGIFSFPVVDLIALSALLIAANGSIMVAARQIHAFSLEGAFPRVFRRIFGPFPMPIVLFAFLTILVIPLIILAPIAWLVYLGSTMFMVCMLVTNLTAIYSHRAEPARRRPFVVPFAPLVPVLAVVMIVFLIFSMPGMILISALAWLFAGTVFYLTYARLHQVEAQEGEVVFGHVQKEEAQEARFRILLPIGEGEERYLVLRIAAALARQLHAEIIPLQVIPVPDPLAIEEGRRIAQERNMLFRWSTRVIENVDVPVHPITRLARTVSEGIIDTAIEEECNLILISWDVQPAGREARIGPTLSIVTRESPCDIAVVAYQATQTYGEVSRSAPTSKGNGITDSKEEGATHFPESILVPTSGGPNVPLATRLALLLARGHETTVTTVYIADENATQEEIGEGNLRIQQTINNMREQAVELSRQIDKKINFKDVPIEGRVIKSSNIVSGIAKAGAEYDLLLLGASEESLIDQMLFGTIPEQVARESCTPVVIVKRYSGLPRLWLRRVWNALYDSLPTLSQEEQIEVYRSIHREARPVVDFFIMIGLSALIATFGLLQNSTAVIIGAMLVAPLFSPILAMSLAVIQGKARLLRLGIESTLKGVALAVGLSLLLALLSPYKTVTAEISSRSLPTIFDLLVALASGSAGAYAVARKDVAAALPGVAIAAALVPPLGVIGISLAMGNLGVAGGGTLLFATNLVAIILAGGVTFLLLGFRPGARGARDRQLRRGLLTTIILFMLITIPLGIFFIRSIQSSRLSQSIQNNLAEQLNDLPQVQLVSRDAITIGNQGNDLIVTVPVYAQGNISTSLSNQLSQELSSTLQRPVIIRLVIYSVIESSPASAGP
jgi:uncharacterized hydrophobic protein (TIGR00271 family)